MELDEAIARRRMCRSFLDRPVPPSVVDRVVARAAQAPSAGNTQGWDWLVLEEAAERRRFWELDAEPAWLAHPDHPGLLAAPVLVVPLAGRVLYEARYAEADKRRNVGEPAAGGDQGRAVVVVDGPAAGPGGASGRQVAGGPGAWQVPYWLTDTAFATMLLLLGAVEEGLGALLFALHGDAGRTLGAFGVPPDRVALGAVALGWPDPGDRPGSSAGRRRRPLDAQIHRGGW